MKYKKFFIIPALIFIYLFFIVDFLVNFNPAIYAGGAAPSGAGQPVGIGESISVVVTRPYFFNLIRLPVYTNYVGYIGGYHEAFFYFVGILTVIFIIIEWRNARVKKVKWGK